ncbi:transposase [Nakamurella sp. PAMC28650]|uniref:IS66 family transposase n=1 Tax=Nakamurella sp. PAMC28650 TaxID=2762325 RepID=UPI00164D28DE|nr:transposase [Nakamurella sp. PAMC28650]
MADTLTAAHRAATAARTAGQDRLDATTLATLLNHTSTRWPKAAPTTSATTANSPRSARTLIRRFHRYQDMILRFTTDLTIPWTNNQAQRDLRPVKIAQRTSGGCWRTLAALTDFATVHSYPSTAGKWGKNKLDALTELFTTGPWRPPALMPS